MTKAFQEAYRRRIHNEELERQLSRMVIDEDKAEPVIRHQLIERTLVQEVLCDFSMDLSSEDFTARKVRAMDGLVLLASRREVRQPRMPSPSPPPESYDTETPTEYNQPEQPAEIPLVLRKKQCIFCVGDEQLSHADRLREFSRVSHMMTHVENVHLKHKRRQGRFLCQHPHCKHLGDFLTSLDHFKNHVQQVHGVRLRA